MYFINLLGVFNNSQILQQCLSLFVIEVVVVVLVVVFVVVMVDMFVIVLVVAVVVVVLVHFLKFHKDWSRGWQVIQSFAKCE